MNSFFPFSHPCLSGKGDEEWSYCINHKKLFLEISENFCNIDEDFKNSLEEFCKNPCHQTLDQVRESRGFTNLVKELLSYKKQTKSHISVLYLKDVSSMLALVSAVRESNIERHMEAERVRQIKHLL